MRRIMIAALAVAGTLALSAGCEQKGSTPAQRGGTTSAPMSRGPGGSDTARAPSDLSGTGGSGDAGMGRDAGMMR